MGNCCSRSRCGRSFSTQYVLSNIILSRGTFGVVKRCTHKDTRKRYAVRVSRIDDFELNRILYMITEDKICPRLQHENIVKFREGMFEGNSHYAVFEEILGRCIFAEICDKKHYSERDAINYLQQILSAIQYCHERNIVHRDLRPTRIMLRPLDDRIKLIDFGLAVITRGDEKDLFGRIEATLYTAPEMFESSPYGKPVDMWACGLILYNLLTGRHPFVHEDPDYYREFVIIYDYSFLTDAGLSNAAQDLVRNLICSDDSRRMTAARSLAHEYITSVENSSEAHRENTIRNLVDVHGFLSVDGTASFVVIEEPSLAEIPSLGGDIEHHFVSTLHDLISNSVDETQEGRCSTKPCSVPIGTVEAEAEDYYLTPSDSLDLLAESLLDMCFDQCLSARVGFATSSYEDVRYAESPAHYVEAPNHGNDVEAGIEEINLTLIKSVNISSGEVAATDALHETGVTITPIAADESSSSEVDVDIDTGSDEVKQSEISGSHPPGSATPGVIRTDTSTESDVFEQHSPQCVPSNRPPTNVTDLTRLTDVCLSELVSPDFARKEMGDGAGDMGSELEQNPSLDRTIGSDMIKTDASKQLTAATPSNEVESSCGRLSTGEMQAVYSLSQRLIATNREMKDALRKTMHTSFRGFSETDAGYLADESICDDVPSSESDQSRQGESAPSQVAVPSRNLAASKSSARFLSSTALLTVRLDSILTSLCDESDGDESPPCRCKPSIRRRFVRLKDKDAISMPTSRSDKTNPKEADRSPRQNAMFYLLADHNERIENLRLMARTISAMSVHSKCASSARRSSDSQVPYASLPQRIVSDDSSDDDSGTFSPGATGREPPRDERYATIRYLVATVGDTLENLQSVTCESIPRSQNESHIRTRTRSRTRRSTSLSSAHYSPEALDTNRTDGQVSSAEKLPEYEGNVLTDDTLLEEFRRFGSNESILSELPNIELHVSSDESFEYLDT